MKILIVDDEPGLASGLAAWLTETGWPAPGVALNGDDAVAWINQAGGIDVLVTDVVMDPTDGFTLRDTIQPHFPKMKTIFISGYDLSEHAARMENDTFLPKPLTGDTLDEALRKLFETPAPSVVASASAPQAVVPPAVVQVSAPKAVSASPRVGAQPSSVHVQPQAAGTPRAVSAQPRASTPQPVAARAVASASPRVASPSVPKAAVATAGPSSVDVDPREVEVELPPDGFVGTTVGEYQIEAKIGEGSKGGIYRALQTSIGRTVRLYLLRPELAVRPEEVENFIANASMKANVSHPYIFAVYEAGESSGTYFYSCEYVPCRSLRQLREAGGLLDEKTAAQAMRAAVEVLGYFHQKDIPHNFITENAILLAGKNKPRVANIAAQEPSAQFTSAEEMAALSVIFAAVLDPAAAASKIGSLTVEVSNGTQTYGSWSEFSQAVTDCIPKIAPEDAYKLDAQERAAIRMVEEAKKKQKRGMLIGMGVSLTLVGILLGIVGWIIFTFVLVRKDGKDFYQVITIPAGEFIYQDGQKVNLPEFNIDQYEVTISQYAKFLEYLQAHPGEAAKFDSPDQPKGKLHIPEGWADEKLATGGMPGYYTRAIRWRKFHDAALDVNSPVFGVDWYDAYAYAKWKGRALPTEQQWEKAARGTDGFKYPWGNQDNERLVNSGNDTDRAPDRGGEKDGYDAWSPVDGVRGDKSPFGVMDMAGNVSEWTSTLDVDPLLSSQQVPVIRGGNWRTPKDYAVTRRVLKLAAGQSDEALGFRTVSAPPAK